MRDSFPDHIEECCGVRLSISYYRHYIASIERTVLSRSSLLLLRSLDVQSVVADALSSAAGWLLVGPQLAQMWRQSSMHSAEATRASYGYQNQVRSRLREVSCCRYLLAPLYRLVLAKQSTRFSLQCLASFTNCSVCEVLHRSNYKESSRASAPSATSHLSYR